MFSFSGALRKMYIMYYARIHYPPAADLFTHMTEEEKYRLHLLAKETGKTGMSCFLEVGSYLGASALCIASGISGNNILYCVDTWRNDAMSEGRHDTYEQFLHNIKACSDRITPLRGESAAVAATFDKAVDFLFLDGDHSYEGVKADVEAWWPKLRPDGVIVMHDIGWAEGVQRIVQEFIMPRSRKHGRLPNLFWATKTAG